MVDVKRKRRKLRFRLFSEMPKSVFRAKHVTLGSAYSDDPLFDPLDMFGLIIGEPQMFSFPEIKVTRDGVVKYAGIDDGESLFVFPFKTNMNSVFASDFVSPHTAYKGGTYQPFYDDPFLLLPSEQTLIGGDE